MHVAKTEVNMLKQPCIPFYTRDAVKAKIKELLELGIIEPVNGATPWV